MTTLTGGSCKREDLVNIHRMETGDVASTRFSQSGAIVYDAVQTGDGWRVEVVFPPKIPVSDRIVVLNWLEGYRTSIRQQYPLWLTALHTKPSRLWLDIKPISGVRELVEKGPDRNIKGMLEHLMTTDE